VTYRSFIAAHLKIVVDLDCKWKDFQRFANGKIAIESFENCMSYTAQGINLPNLKLKGVGNTRLVELL